MKAYELEAVLNGYKGKTIRYQDKRGTVMRWELKERTLKLVTDQQDIIILVEDIEESLAAIEVDDLTPAPIIQGNTSMIGRINGDLERILMDNIRKVNESKDNIPQAQEVNAQAKSLIDLAKAEIEYMKTLAYFHKKK